MKDDLYIECDCMSFDHVVRFQDMGDDGINIDIRLNHYLPWYKRVWYGARYILGLNARTGWQYDTVEIYGEKVKALRNFCDNWLCSSSK